MIVSQSSLLNASAIVHWLTTPQWDVCCPKKSIASRCRLADNRYLVSSEDENVTVGVDVLIFVDPSVLPLINLLLWSHDIKMLW